MTDILTQRLHNQLLTNKRFRKPEDVVSWFGAMQAQDFQGGKWAIGLRLPKATNTSIEQAIADRKIVRTWPMRGTLHFVAAKDVRWILDLMSHRASKILATHYKKYNLTEAILEKGHKIIADSLEGGKHLTKKELMTALGERGIDTGEGRSYLIIIRACLDGLICQGPRRNKEFTFTLLEEWVPKTKPMKREQALEEFTRRYFESHGPATLQDFSWWSGLTMVDVKAGIELAKRHLQEENIAGKLYWASREKAKPLQSAGLLQPWDEYVVAYKDRSAIIDNRYAKQLVGSGNGVFIQSILVNGRVVGAWRKTTKKNTVTVTSRFFSKVDRKQESLVANAITSYEEFMKN